MVYKCFDKKSKDTITHTGTGTVSEDQQTANELYRPITRKFIITQSIFIFSR